MDAAKPVGKKAQPPAAGADTEPAVETPSPSPSSTLGPDDAIAVAGGEEAEDDDEQVERFYALLDNIRAMRGMLGGGSTGTGGTAAAETGRRKRRAREAAEPPWRPAFRMEDFEVVEEADSDSAAGCAAVGQPKEKGKIDDDRREEEEDGEVVVEAEEGPPRKARRAGVLTVSIHRTIGRSSCRMN